MAQESDPPDSADPANTESTVASENKPVPSPTDTEGVLAETSDDDSADPTTDDETAAASPADRVNPNTSALPIQTVSPEEIRRLVQAGQYVPYPRSKLQELVPFEHPVDTGDRLPPPTISNAVYTATLSGDSLINGKLRIQRESAHVADSFLLGRTSLNELKFTVAGSPLTLASLSDGRLSLLSTPPAGVLEATWSARGTAISEGIEFDLQLPPAYIAKLQLKLPDDIVISRSNAIVRRETDGESGIWTLYPRAGYPVTFVCSSSGAAGAKPQAASLAIDTTFHVTEGTVLAEWKLVAPSALDDSAVVLAVGSDCRITDVRAESGSYIPWSVAEDGRQLVLPRLLSGQTIVIRGVAQSEGPGPQSMPFLSVVQQAAAGTNRVALSLRSTGLQLIVARDLVVQSLKLDGLYQTEVSFNSEGEQVIELQPFDVAVAASIDVEAAAVTYHQRLLVHRPTAAPGIVTVYAEVQPRSGQIWGMEWDLSGPWQPTSVEDLSTDTNLPVYSRIDHTGDDGSDVLQVEFRNPATAGQPARLKIEFRSTQAVTPQTSSLPGLTSDRCRSMGTWILSPSAAPGPGEDVSETIEGIQEELLKEFPWVPDDLGQADRLRLVRTDHLPVLPQAAVGTESTIPRVNLEYRLRLNESLVTEDILLRVDPADQLPESMILLFPDGIDVQLIEARSGEELSSTGRGPDGQWQEWLLTLPPMSELEHRVILRATRPVSVAEFAALPRLPNTSEVTFTARNISDEDAGFERAELVRDSAGNAESDRENLEPHKPVSIARILTRWRLQLTHTSVADAYLGVRGSVWMMASRDAESDTRRCLADLVVSRTGAANALRIRWPDASDIQVFIDDHRVFCPVTESLMDVLLPPDQELTGVRILWNSQVAEAGWMTRTDSVALPEFLGANRLDLAHWIQIGNDRVVTDPGQEANGQVSGSPRLITVNPSIRDFLMQWRMEREHGAVAQLTPDRAGQVSFQATSRRWLTMVMFLSFWATVSGSRLLAGFRLRYVAMMMVIGVIAATFTGPGVRSLLFGWNAGLAALLIMRTCWEPLVAWWSQTRSAGPRTTEARTSLVISSLLALLLTGQAPSESNGPPVLTSDDSGQTSQLVFVRKDLVPVVPASDVRVQDVTAQVHITPGGTEIIVDAVLASRQADSGAVFTVPLEDATLTQCSLNGEPVTATYGPGQQPQIRLPDSDQESQSDSIGSWRQDRVRYTLRSGMKSRSGRRAIRVPLPFFSRCQVTLMSESDPILSAQLSNGQTAVRDSGLMTFPVQYNHGALDILVETQRSRHEASNVSREVAVVCRADMTESRTALTCRYRQTSTGPLPSEVTLPLLPGFNVGNILSADETPLKSTLRRRELVVRGTREQLADFQVTWEPSFEQTDSVRIIPAAALRPPLRSSADRTVLAVRVSDPFEVKTAIVADSNMNTLTISPEERQTLGLAPSDRCFELTSPSDDIRLELGLQPITREVDIAQTLVVGVNQVEWACQCNMTVNGPLTFRQRVNVPRDLLVDQVRVAAGNVGRLRSWSLRDGVLLVSFGEGTRGNYQLSFNGILPVPEDGRVRITPVTVEAADVIESTLQLSSTAGATVVVEDGESSASSPTTLPLVNPTLPLTLHTRLQNQTTARLLVLTDNGTGVPKSDIAYRILARDQIWDGSLQLPEELGEPAIEWITDGNSTPLTAEDGELQMPRLDAGQSATLLLRGVETPEDSNRRLSLPDLDPAVSVSRVLLYARLSNATLPIEAETAWMLQTLQGTDSGDLPRGIVERGREEHYDAQENSIRLVGAQTDSSVPVSVVRRAASSVSVTHLYSADDFLFGATDILVDSGEADSVQCAIPSGMQVIGCELNGTELPQTADTSVISFSGQESIQRLTVRWLVPCPAAGYLPWRHSLIVPMVSANEQRQFLAMHYADGRTWSAGASLVGITEAQLTTHVSQLIVEPSTEGNRDEESGADSPDIVSRFLNDNQSGVRPPNLLYEMTGSTADDIAWRLTLPWVQWLPVVALAVAWGTVTGRRTSWLRRRDRKRVIERAMADQPALTDSDVDSSSSALDSNHTPG